MRTIFLMLLLASTQCLHAQPERQSTPEADARNAITFTPVGFMVAYEQFNPCVGIDYEYILNSERCISFHLPLVFGYAGPEQDGILGSSYKHTAFYGAPGVRFHAPLGKRYKRAAFITGPSLLVGNMHMRKTDYNSFGAAYTESLNYALTGLAADNTLNVYNRNFVFGIDARVGYVFADHDWSRFFIHFGIHFGGKF